MHNWVKIWRGSRLWPLSFLITTYKESHVSAVSGLKTRSGTNLRDEKRIYSMEKGLQSR